jgi:uncharacterized protein (TIGR00369 family)
VFATSGIDPMSETPHKLLLEDDKHCFVCGADNPAGLKLRWDTSGKETHATFTPDNRYQGWKNVVHGGILSTLLDEAMTRLVWELHGPAVTAEVTIRYLAPAVVGESLKIMGRIVDDSKRLVTAQAEVSKSDGTPVARAESRILVLKKENT